MGVLIKWLRHPRESGIAATFARTQTFSTACLLLLVFCCLFSAACFLLLVFSLI
jgi:hypothetical protein